MPRFCVSLLAGLWLAGCATAPAHAPSAGNAPGLAAPPPPPAPLSVPAVVSPRFISAKFSGLFSQLSGGFGMKFLLLPAGTFLMGSAPGEADRGDDEGPQTRVIITRDFFLGVTDVTQGQYQTLMGANPSDFKMIGPDAPVDNISWAAAMAFCQKLTAREQAAGLLPSGCVFTLPTEAQWEYACRAGTTGAYAGDPAQMAWYGDNSGGHTHPVATKHPNAWGLYDMTGNVYQWCLDWYGKYPGGDVRDWSGPPTGTAHVLRGGSWYYQENYCRSAYRDFDPGFVGNIMGFRVALVVASPPNR